jgi:hypothetical protein
MVQPTKATAARDSSGYFQYNSNGFFTSPLEMQVEPIQGFLGTSPGGECPLKIARADVMLPCASTTIINTVYNDTGSTAVATGRVNTGCEFIR